MPSTPTLSLPGREKEACPVVTVTERVRVKGLAVTLIVASPRGRRLYFRPGSARRPGRVHAGSGGEVFWRGLGAMPRRRSIGRATGMQWLGMCSAPR